MFTICILSCISSAMNGRTYYCSKTTISDMNCRSFKQRLKRNCFDMENMKYTSKYSQKTKLKKKNLNLKKKLGKTNRVLKELCRQEV